MYVLLRADLAVTQQSSPLTALSATGTKDVGFAK
jgi:hypothetical protein